MFTFSEESFPRPLPLEKEALICLAKEGITHTWRRKRHVSRGRIFLNVFDCLLFTAKDCLAITTRRGREMRPNRQCSRT